MKTRGEKIREVEDKILAARDLMFEAYVELEEAADRLDDLDGHSSRNARAYLLDHFRIMIDNNHGFMSNDLNCEKWIENIYRSEEEYEIMEEERFDREEEMYG